MTVVSRFGLLGDYDAMGDLEALADDLRAAIDDLSARRRRRPAGRRVAQAPRPRPHARVAVIIG